MAKDVNMKHFVLTYVFYNGALPKQYECYAKSEKDARRQCRKALDITDSKIIKVESEEQNDKQKNRKNE